MKTIEEKAKAYDKARERAEKVLKTQYTAHWDKHKELIEHLFPELAESEDEKIRKKIIQLVNDTMATNAPYKKEMLALLEKQGEQKPAEWSEEDMKMINTLINTVKISRSSCEEDDDIKDRFDDELKWLNSLKCRVQPQPKQEWSEEDEHHINSLLSRLDGICKNEFVRTTFAVNEDKDWLKLLRYKAIPQKQEWSEEYLNFLTDTEYLLRVVKMENRSDNEYQRAEKCIDWLKSLKDRVQQQEQMWSIEDEYNQAWIVEMLYGLEDEDKEYEKKCRKMAEWLKSLRPQKQQYDDEWSDEDKEFLKWTLSNLAELKDRYGEDYGKVGKCIDWLNSLQPQPIDVEAAIAYQEGYQKAVVEFSQKQQEWTDEDINMIDWLIRCCEKEHEELCNDRYGHQDIVSDLKRDCRKKWDWLESLKGKVAPQKQWKPSKEQIEAVEKALSLAKNCGEEYSFDLRTLLEQLKAL